MTRIAIAHWLSTARDANQLHVLHQGCVQQYATHRELMQVEGLYSPMYELQLQTGRVMEE